MISFLILCGTQLDFTPGKAKGNSVTLLPLGSVALGRTPCYRGGGLEVDEIKSTGLPWWRSG